MILDDLHTTALTSERPEDWAAFAQALAGMQLVIPLEEAAGETARPRLTLHEDVNVLPAWTSMDAFAGALADPGHYAELAGAELAGALAGQGTPLLVFADGPLVVTPEQLDWIAQTYGAEVTRATGQGVQVTAPELPPLPVMEMLGQSVGALGMDCPEAWLVAMSAPHEASQDASDTSLELVLVLGLADKVRDMEGQIADTVTRAVQTVTELPFAVACPDRGAPLMDTARRVGIGIGGGD
ncbi:MAG: hypothetical protein AB8B85_03175 [Paracoccaceae bacterium]